VYRWISGLMVGALVLGVGIGCGGGSDETGSDVTKAQFVKKADFVCADSKRERTAIGEETFNPKQRQGSHTVGAQSTEEVEAELEELGEELVSEKIVPSLKNQQKKLEAIGAPAADEAKVEKMLDNMETAIGELEKEGYRGVFGNQFDEFEKEAETYGLKCKVT
jgi:hypothetical protein